jgi:hypothetical protein
MKRSKIIRTLAASLVHDQLAILGVIAEWNEAAHPHPALAGSCDFVADTLADDFALELCE